MNKPEIVLIGAGGHCHACIDVVELEGLFDIAGVVDKALSAGSGDVLGYPIIGSDADLMALRSRFEYALISVGQIHSSDIRMRLAGRLRELGFQLPTIISPRAYVSRHAWVGEGSMVMHNAVVNAGASVGDHCIINSQCLIEHDAVIGNHVHVSTRSVINGAGKVGEQSFVGSGAVVVNGVELAPHSFVRAGTLVRSQADCSCMRDNG